MRINDLLLIGAMVGMLTTSHAGELKATVTDSEGHALEDAVVTAMPTDPSLLPKFVSSKPIVDQVNKEFLPYVNPIYVNSEVSFPNKDNIRHQVYSFSPAKKFELPLYSGTTAPPVLFDKPGVVILGCNIHDWMIGYIYVSATPFFAKTGPDGRVDIRNIPAGDYLVRVWHPRLIATEESTTHKLNLSATESADVAWKLTLKAPFKWPRAAHGTGFGY